MAQQSVLHLYRDILKAAKHFPSIKRNRIIANIKVEFHENKGLTDPVKKQQCIAVATRGLSDLQAYLPNSRTDGQGSSSVTLKGMTE